MIDTSSHLCRDIPSTAVTTLAVALPEAKVENKRVLALLVEWIEWTNIYSLLPRK
jgi:hypothetical protein